MAVSFKGAHFPQDIILTCVRWYVAYPLSTRHVEELMRERGVPVDHATVNRWVIKYSPRWRRPFIAASGRYGAVGGWTRPILRSKVSGATSTAPSIRRAKRSTSC
jgi:putative transposase